MKRLISTILCMVIVLTSIASLNVFAENGTLEPITLDAITNKSLGGDHISKLVSGAKYAEDLFLTTADFVKDRKDSQVYLLIDNIKDLTRSKINNIDNGYIISQGCLHIKLNRHDNMYTILYSIGSNGYKPLSYNSNNVEIEYVTYNNKEYIEPDVIMSLLSAECTFDIIDGKRTMLVNLPEYTLFEALADMDTEKYFVGDLLEADVNKNGNILTNFPQHFINFKRLYNQFGTDILLNLRYEVFNPAGTDYLIRSDMKDAYADIIGYDVYTGKKVADTESKIFSAEKGLESLLKTAVEKKNSKGKLMKFFDSMFLYKGNDSEKMAEVAHKTSEDLSKNLDITSKLNSMGISSAKTILTRTVLEYIKRHSYDQEVLEKFRNTFSEDSRKLAGLNLSQNDNKKYQYAIDYYNTCFNDSELLNEIVEDVVYKNVMKFIVMLPFDWATAGAASKYTGLYEKCLSVEKLRESYDKNFTLNPLDYIKPVNSMNAGMDYIQLTIVQRLIHSVFEKTENEFLNDIDLSTEKYKLFTDSLDMYCRTSIVMMNKLKKSWQLGIISQKEIDIINNVDNYISELTELIYKIENCKLPNFSEDNILENKPIEFEFSYDGIITGKVVTENNEPIKNAKATANNKEVYTNANGEFSISLPKGNYSLEVTCDGYKPAKIAHLYVQPGKTTKLNDIVLKIDSQKYRDNFISALLANENQWFDDYGSTVGYPSMIEFKDLDFDGVPELIMQLDGGSMRNCDAYAYSLHDGKLVKSKMFQNVLNYYQDTKTNKKKIVGTHTWRNGEYESDLNEFEFTYDGKDVATNYFLGKHIQSDRYGTPSYQYYTVEGSLYDYDSSQNTRKKVSDISQDQYDKIKIAKSDGLEPLYVKTDSILASDYKSYTNSKKKEVLEKAYDSFGYYLRSDEVQYYNGQHYYTPINRDNMTNLSNDFSTAKPDYIPITTLNEMFNSDSHGTQRRLSIDNFIIVDDKIYFTCWYYKDAPFEADKLYVCNMDGTNVKLICDSTAHDFIYFDGKIYYQTVSEPNNRGGYYAGANDKTYSYDTKTQTNKVSDEYFDFNYQHKTLSWNDRYKFNLYEYIDHYYYDGMMYLLYMTKTVASDYNCFTEATNEQGDVFTVSRWFSIQG